MPPGETLTNLFRRHFIAAWAYALVALLILMMYQLRGVAVMFALAGLLAYLLAPPIAWLTRKWGRHNLFVAIVFVVFILLVLTLFGSFVPILIQQGQDLVKSAPELLQRLEFWLNAMIGRYNLGSEVRFSEYLNNVAGQLQGQGTQNLSKVFHWTRTFLSSTAAAVASMIFIPMMTLYLLLDAPRLRRTLVGLFADRHKESVNTALTAVNHSLGGYIYSRVVLAAFVWITYTIVLSAFGVPYALLLGLLAFIGEFIPVVGNIIAFIPIALLTLLTVPSAFVWILIIIVVIQGLQNYVISPKIMSEAMDMHPLTVVLVMLAGGTLAGGVGLLLALPVAAAIKAIFNVVVVRRKELGINFSIVDLARTQNDDDPTNDYQDPEFTK